MADLTAGTHHVRDYPPPETDGLETTRGQFLTLSTVGFGAMIGAVIGVPATAYVLAPVTQEIHFTPVKLGKVTDFPSEGGQFKPKSVVFVEDANNPNTSSALAYVHNTGNSNTSQWNAQDAMFVVFSNRCMHLGCPIQAALTGFACPCHGGQYDQQGKRIAGPPIRSLDRFAWEVRNGGELWLTDRWSTDIAGDEVRYYDVKMPGQPVTTPGPGLIADVLYPNVSYTPNGPTPAPTKISKA